MIQQKRKTMTRIYFHSSIGLYEKYTMYWNGVAFTDKIAEVAVLDPIKMWSWLEEFAPIVALAFPKRVTIETI